MQYKSKTKEKGIGCVAFYAGCDVGQIQGGVTVDATDPIAQSALGGWHRASVYTSYGSLYV
jgi:hypothetical protein